jgi:hypothetical protein
MDKKEFSDKYIIDECYCSEPCGNWCPFFCGPFEECDHEKVYLVGEPYNGGKIVSSDKTGVAVKHSDGTTAKYARVCFR